MLVRHVVELHFLLGLHRILRLHVQSIDHFVNHLLMSSDDAAQPMLLFNHIPPGKDEKR